MIHTGDITINGGVIEATGARPCAGIGGSGKCKWSGKDHSSNFRHAIFCFRAHLFGRK